MKVLVTFFFVLLISPVFAQFNIKGFVLNEEKEPLPFASAVVLKSSDTSIVAFGLTNDKGKYVIEVPDSGNYLLQLTFLGYASQILPLNANWGKKEIIVPTVQMKKSEVELEDIRISADRIPLRMKGDTILYDAKAFDTPEGSDVEKLLEKLPGFEIDAEGNLTAQGKRVEKVLVDGKEFFGDDPKMATKNLEAKVVDKVEVLDKKSENAEFTGIDDGDEKKTVNLVLKEDFKKGSFGKITVGAGTEETYKGKINYNAFNKDSRISMIGNTNNLNESPFTFSEYIDFEGPNPGGQIMYNSDMIDGISGGGINESSAGGLNLNHSFSEKVELNTHYFVTHKKRDLQKTIASENFTPEETYSTNQNLDNDELNTNHSLKLNVKWKPDSMTLVTISTNSQLKNENYDNLSRTIYSPSNELTNFTESNTQTEKDKFSSFAGLNYKRKFKKKRRNIEFWGNYYLLDQENKTQLNNEQFGEQINQTQLYDYTINKPKFGASYTEPLDSHVVVSLEYNFLQEENQPTREFFDISSQGSVLNDSLSSQFERMIMMNSGKVTFKRNKKKKNYKIGTAISTNRLEAAGVSRDFQFLRPFASARFKLKGSQSLRLRYNTRVRFPSLNQLVTIPNNTNPNQNYIGNPDLKPEYTHDVSLNFNYFNSTNSSYLYGGINAMKTLNKIINQRFVNSDRIINISPVNSGFYENYGAYGGMNMPLKKLKIKYSISPQFSFSRFNTFLNNEETEVAEKKYSARTSISRLKKEKWNVVLGFNISYTQRAYELNSSFDQDFFNYSWKASGEYEFKKDILLLASYSIQQYNDVFFSASRVIDIVNASIRKSFQDDKWAITLIANDILNENIGIRRSGNINGLRDESYNTRAQYFMISLERSLGKRKKPENNFILD